jgi:magnesium chelatase family protein
LNMSLAVLLARAAVGVAAPKVTVEVQLSGGLPGFSIVGLAEAEVKESRDRVRAAIINAGYEFPVRKVTVNLAPADLPKEGGRFDLAIALGILIAHGQLPNENLGQYEFYGELALSGDLRAVRGLLPAVLKASKAGRTVIVPSESAYEAGLIESDRVLHAATLLQVCAHLRGAEKLPRCPSSADLPPIANPAAMHDMRDVRGQHLARRALEVAATGAHNILFIGPPGTGKSMLAQRLPTIMPPLTPAEALENAAIASVSSTGVDIRRWRDRPFRNPHHTASGVALCGGGSTPKPGEISLAHNGVLFLDELTEWERNTLEVLREPIESGRIIISRAARHAEFPARFQLIAAMNPCPCGYAGDPSARCQCSPEQVRRYRGRLSGPLLDRIDIQIEVPRVPQVELRATEANQPEDSALVRARVIQARDVAIARAGKPNSQLSAPEVNRDCALSARNHELLDRLVERCGLSARAYHRILKLSRSIADLAQCADIEAAHLAEAVSLRRVGV